MSGLNGLAFLMLALAILNYGWKLEAIISKSKLECEMNLVTQDKPKGNQSARGSP